MFEDLRGQVALVSGGARGIGLASATALAELGVDVVLTDLLPQVEASAAELAARTGVRAVGLTGDVTDVAAMRAVVADATAALGTPTILVNAAGISGNHDAIDMPVEAWTRVMAVNVTGTFITCQAFAQSCVAADVPGTIVNIASMSGRIVNIPQHQSAYNSSKSAVEAMTKSLAVEWFPLGIRVNAVSPGYILSDMTRDVVAADPEMAQFWRSRIPAGEMGEPEDVGGLVAYLASSASRYVVGQSFVIDGGYTIL